MKQEPKFWTIQQWKQARQGVRVSLIPAAVGASLVAGCLLLNVCFPKLMKPADATPTGKAVDASFTGVLTCIGAGCAKTFGSADPPVLVTRGRAYRALRLAVQKWSRELGVALKIPPLYTGDRAGLPCGEEGYTRPETLACWNHDKKAIMLVRGQETKNYLFNVMLHEFGHSLGVPHIQGDPLMNSSVTEEDMIERPIPPAALALAKCYMDKVCK